MLDPRDEMSMAEQLRQRSTVLGLHTQTAVWAAGDCLGEAGGPQTKAGGLWSAGHAVPARHKRTFSITQDADTLGVARRGGQDHEPSGACSMTMRVSSTREAMLSLRKAWRR